MKLLYITSDRLVGQLDYLKDDGHIVNEIAGDISLNNFIDRILHSYKPKRIDYIVIDLSTVIEKDEELLKAIDNFRFHTKAKLIFITALLNDDCYNENILLDKNYTNIINTLDSEHFKMNINELICNTPIEKANKIEEIKPIKEAIEKYTDDNSLSIEIEKNLKNDFDEDKEDYKTVEQFDIELKKNTLFELFNSDVTKKWNATGITIGFIGSDRRVGTTTTAINMAYWLKSNGAKVCYIKANKNDDLFTYMKVDELEAVDNVIVIEDIDFILNLNIDIDKDYNFIIYDIDDSYKYLIDNLDETIILVDGSLQKLKNYVQFTNSVKGENTVLSLPYEKHTYSTDMNITELEYCNSWFNKDKNMHIWENIVKDYIL